jgi:hypothetical protein
MVERVVYRGAACVQLAKQAIEALGQIAPADVRHVHPGVGQYLGEICPRTFDGLGIPDQG